jgi:hypothetical protein
MGEMRWMRKLMAKTRPSWPMSSRNAMSATCCCSASLPITNAAATADSSTPTNIHTKLPVRKPSRGTLVTKAWSRRVFGVTVGWLPET